MRPAAWAAAAASDLFPAPLAALEALPPWALEEPAWTRLGLLHADVLRRARNVTASRHGIHAYRRLLHAAIVEPEALADYLEAKPNPSNIALIGAALLHLDRRLSDLELFLAYLAGLEGIDVEDLYDLIGLWGDIEARVERLLRLCEHPDPALAATALATLAASGHRGFVWPLLPELMERIEARNQPLVSAAFNRAFSDQA